MPEPAPLLDRVAASRLTPSGRRLARFYEDSLPGAALMNLQEVCEATGLSSATVVRFARALGYTGFKDMSQRLQAELRAGIDRPIDRLRRGRSPADGALVSRFARARADLDASLAALDPRAFETAADLLGDAGRPLYLGAVASGRPSSSTSRSWRATCAAASSCSPAPTGGRTRSAACPRAPSSSPAPSTAPPPWWRPCWSWPAPGARPAC